MRRGSEPSLTILDDKKPDTTESPPLKDKQNNKIVSFKLFFWYILSHQGPL